MFNLLGMDIVMRAWSRCHGFAGVVLLAANLVAAPGAWAALPLDLEYDGYAAGFPAATLTVRLEEWDAGYRIRGEAHTNGIADWLMHYQMLTESDGTVVPDGLKPALHETTSIGRSYRRVSHLDYSSGVVEAMLTPPPKPDDRRMTPEDVAGTVDPLTAVLSAGRVLAATGSCTQRIKVFDGRRRYDLVLKDEGEEALPPGFGVFSGSARHCSLEMAKFSGALFMGKPADAPTGLAKKHTPIDVWLAPPWPGASPLPVRLDFHSTWGPATVRLSVVKPGGSPPSAAAAR